MGICSGGQKLEIFDFDLGIDAKLYLNGEECPDVRNVQISLTADTTDGTTRRNAGWKTNIPTLKDATVTFELVSTSDSKDAIDEVMATMLGEGCYGKVCVIAALDKNGPDDTLTRRGLFGLFTISNCSPNQENENVIVYSVEVKIARFYGWGANPKQQVDSDSVFSQLTFLPS